MFGPWRSTGPGGTSAIVSGDLVHYGSRTERGSFYESTHLEGSVPMRQVMQALVDEQTKRLAVGRKDVAIPLRPDHGHVLLYDKAKKNAFYPGYSLIGRALGLAELSGLEQGIRNF